VKRGCDPLTVKIKDRTFGSSYMDGLVQKNARPLQAERFFSPEKIRTDWLASTESMSSSQSGLQLG
jgi:hypothetical protein